MERIMEFGVYGILFHKVVTFKILLAFNIKGISKVPPEKYYLSQVRMQYLDTST